MEWISVEDCVPDPKEICILYRPSDFSVIGGYRIESGAAPGISVGFMRYGVTHWMKLPKTPDAKDSLKVRFIDPEEPPQEGIQNRKWLDKSELEKNFPRG